MRRLVWTLAAIGGLYALACAWYYANQDRFIFQRTAPRPPDVRTLDVHFDVDGARLAGHLVNPEGAVNLVYFGGNAEPVSAHAGRFAAIPAARTLLMDYRGYGRSTGSPSETALVADAVRFVPALAAAGRPVLLVGRSLGAGVAALAAAQLGERVAALVLVSPFCSFRNVVERLAPAWLPAGLLLQHPFDVVVYARELPRATTFVIAEGDRIVPPEESACLAAAAGAAPHAVVLLDGRGHNDVFSAPALWAAIESAVAALAGSISAAAGEPPRPAPRAAPSPSRASSRG
jgi:hypothetical protein